MTSDLDADLSYICVDVSKLVPSLSVKVSINFCDCRAHDFHYLKVSRNKLKSIFPSCACNS